MNRLLILAALLAGLPSIQADDDLVASVRSAVVEAQIGDKSVSVAIAATGQFPTQRIDSIEVDLNGKELFVPAGAFRGSVNPNPGAVQIRSATAAPDFSALMPLDLQEPLLWITVDSFGGGWSLILAFEDESLAFSLVATQDKTECRPFAPGYQDVCALPDRHNEGNVAGADAVDETTK